MTDCNWEILCGFLRSPLQRTNFDAFFDLTFRQTVSYLRHLQSRGYRLPLDDRTDTDPIADLAVDLLGDIAAPEKGLLFPGLFAMLRKQCDPRYRDQDRDIITSLYSAFLTVQIRQRLSRLRKDRDPETENLKRRLKDVLNEPPFETVTGVGDHEKIVRIAQSNGTARSPIPHELLRHCVESAFIQSKTRAEWCELLFALLSKAGVVSPLVQLHDFLTIAVEVNSIYVENSSRPSGPFPNPRLAFVGRRAEVAMHEAIEQTRNGALARFISSGRLSSADGGHFLSALTKFMEDFSATGETDPIPVYFRESMPSETHSRYLRDYKYLLETVLNDCRDRFIEIMRDDPTIRGLGDYS